MDTSNLLVSKNVVMALYRDLEGHSKKNKAVSDLYQSFLAHKSVFFDQPNMQILNNKQNLALAKLLFSSSQEQLFSKLDEEDRQITQDINHHINIIKSELLQNISQFIESIRTNTKERLGDSPSLVQKKEALEEMKKSEEMLFSILQDLIDKKQDNEIQNFLKNPVSVISNSVYENTLIHENYQTQINRYYEEIFTDIYKNIGWIKKGIEEKKEKEGKNSSHKLNMKIELERGDSWTMHENPHYGIKTWTLTNEENKSDPRLGSNGQLIVKEIDEAGYNYINTEDLYTRAQLFFDTARWLITDSTKSHTYQLNNNAKDLFKKINQEERAFLNESSEWKLDVEKMKNLETRVAYFEEKYPKAEKSIKESLKNLLFLLHEANSKYSVEGWKEIIREEEKNWIHQKGRPNVINISQLRDVNNENTIKVISAQLTQGGQTKPSSKRDLGSSSDSIPNHIKDIQASIISRNGKDEIHVHSALRGHASYSHFMEDNRLQRRLANVGDVEEVLASFITTLYAANPDLLSREGIGSNPQNPIECSLASMILLTPRLGSKTDRSINHAIAATGIVAISPHESEYRQLKDIQFALEILRFKTSPLSVSLANGYSVFVQFNPTYMNLPVNVGKSLQELFDNPLQQNINARGFVEYNEAIDRYVNEFLEKTVNYQESLSKEVNEKFSAVLKNSLNFIKDLYLPSEKLMTQKREIKKIESKLNEIADSLEHLRKQQHLVQAKSEKEKFEKNYSEKEKLFFKTLKDVYQHYDKVNMVYKNNYEATYPFGDTKLREEIARLLKALPKTPDQDDDAHKHVREFALTMERHLTCLDSFYHKKYQNELYQFQTVYVLNHQVLGHETESFCKSAEDRTGWLRVQIAAHMNFIQLYGRNPNLSAEKDLALMAPIVRKTHEMAASLDNTFFNSHARGLQLNASLINPKDLGLEVGNTSARLAKGAFDLKNIKRNLSNSSLKSTSSLGLFDLRNHDSSSRKDIFKNDSARNSATHSTSNHDKKIRRL